jgi:hypothetical protein
LITFHFHPCRIQRRASDEPKERLERPVKRKSGDTGRQSQFSYLASQTFRSAPGWVVEVVGWIEEKGAGRKAWNLDIAENDEKPLEGLRKCIKNGDLGTALFGKKYNFGLQFTTLLYSWLTSISYDLCAG